MRRQNLREARKAKGLTQREAAQAIGVSVRTWMAWEYGVRTPTLSNAFRIAELLGVPLERIF